MVEFLVNGVTRQLEVAEGKPLLWTLREDLKIKGPKFGCGYGVCGACTVLIDGQAVRSCVVPSQAVQNKEVTTIEGLEDEVGQALKTSWEKLQVPQCGYCQPGMITACASAIKNSDNPDLESVVAEVTNLCRCGTYGEIKEAIVQTLEILNKGES